MDKNQRVRVTIDEEGVKRYVSIESDSFVIGRSPNVEIPIACDLISRQQLLVKIKGGEVWIEDLGSSNGTWVNQEKLQLREKFLLKPGQTISLGSKYGPFVKIEPYAQGNVVNLSESNRDKTGSFEIEETIALKKVANGSPILPDSKDVTSPRRDNLFMVNPAVKSRVAQKKTAVENNVIEQIKQLMNIESEEIHQIATEEAKSICHKANEQAFQVIQRAKDEATQKLREVEQLVNRKTAALQKAENDAHENLKKLEHTHYEISNSVRSLEETESKILKNIAQIQLEIKEEQARIKEEKAFIQHEKKELSEAKIKIENDYHDLELEERKIRARIEVDTLEAKAKITQMQNEAEKAQLLKNTLEPEVYALKLQKEQITSEINETHSERRNLEFDLEKLNKELGIATYNLDIARKDQENTRKEIEYSKQGLLQFEEELNQRDKNSKNSIERAQKELEEAIEHSKIEAKRILDHAHESSEAMIKRAEDELNKIVSRQDKIKAEFERVKEEMSRRTAAAKEEHTSIIQKGKDDSEALVGKAKIEAEGIRSSANAFYEDKQKESQKIIESASKEAASIKESADQYAVEQKKSSDFMIQQLKIEIVNRQRESALAYAEVEEKRKVIEDQIVNLNHEYEQRLLEINKQAESMLELARSEAQQLKLCLESDINDEMQIRKDECESVRLEAEKKRKELALQLEADHKEASQQQQSSLAELRQIEMLSIKELRRKAEEDIQKHKEKNAKNVATNVYAMITSEMYKKKNKVIDDNLIDNFGKDLKEMTIDIMLDNPNANSSKLQDILKIKDRATGKERIFWKKTGTIAGSVAFVILLLVIFPSIVTGPKNALVSALTEKDTSKADAYVQMKLDEAKQRMIFNPPTTPEYKETYFENVLYTTDFEVKRQDQAFQDKWILDLNDFFIHSLDVKDTTIIKFVSLESTLLRDLAKLKGQVDPQNSAPKLQEMRVRENEFKEKLGIIFNDPVKVSKYYEFSKNFWNTYHQPQPVGTSP